MGIKDLRQKVVESYRKLQGNVHETAKGASRRVKNTKPNSVHYKVVSKLEPVMYNKLGHARGLRTALSHTNIESDIIRIEITDEGFIVDERKIK